MNVRRCAAALAAAAVIGAATPALAASPSPTPSVAIPDGLYGTADPTYDGVWRQSLALLAQDTAGVVPADRAVAWLTGQQCANGAFAAFRADPAKPCDAKLMVDSNSTAAAVQALTALGGHATETGKAVAWLKSVQNADGGWGYNPGGASDANSTAVVTGALVAAGERPEQVVKGGKSPYDALLTFALPCTGDGAGAFAYQPDKQGELTANADATAAAVLGALGQPLNASAEKADKTADKTAGKTADKKATATASGCAAPATPEQAARNGARYLSTALAKDHHLVSALPGAENQPDYGNTADAVVALAAAGHADEAAAAQHWLEANAPQWAAQSGPAAYAQLVLAAHATGTDPRAFGSTDLVRLLDATGPAPQQTATKKPEASGTSDDDGSTTTLWVTVGAVVLVVLVAAALFLARARRRQQP
ncbi:prenyltransferase/squalene oxidase repeat-containing protein [Streptomyces longwoodensis]|uniref:prenyltransferase/squalene oxidase repeat-containing protein n=1 Tax=Streptomyces longwoodensis TaxID=68231 RepID=UPI0033DEFE43